MRPVGVTLAAYFEFVRGFLLALAALGVLFVGGVASRVAGLAAEGNALQRFLLGFGKFVGLALLVYAGIQALLGLGLLLRQNWARLLTMLFCGLGVLLLLPRLLHMRPISGLFTLLNLVVVIYLALPEARRYFETKENAPPNAA